MQPIKIPKNKLILYASIGGAVLLCLIVVLVIITSSGNKGQQIQEEKKVNTNTELFTTDNIGKALEIQSLLAREGIEAERAGEGSKSTLVLKAGTYTMSQRDRALLAIVKSGIMDRHIGLEIFDKGDFTSSKEDKRIRLARAINGELSRLIKKISPIEDASVFVSIPEQTIFTSMQKPATASVQITLPSDEKLEKDKIRAITNLLMGSIQELEAKHISISDTNGNVYSSLISPEDDMMTLIEDSDKYMKNKVIAQLDHLIGKGNYVVTVSTYLRETPVQTNKVSFDPKQSSVANEQRFEENLGDKTQGGTGALPAVSSYVPNGLPQISAASSGKNYNKSAVESQYNVGRTETSEIQKPGTLEEISIAVTLNNGSMPSGMTLPELKELIARTANPKANPANVEIAFADISSPTLSGEEPSQLPRPESSGNPWWILIIIPCLIVIPGILYILTRIKESSSTHQQEIHTLLKKTERQQNLIRESQEKTARLESLQEELQHKITTIGSSPSPAIPTLQKTISDIRTTVEEDLDEQEFASKLKSWIESA